MPHVSSKKLNSKLLGKLLQKLLEILSRPHDKQGLSLVLNELLTRTEKIMLAKRFAIILMLADNIPQDKITKILKVSPTTVAKASLKRDIGKYKHILQISKKEKVDLEKLVWNILTVWGIMPPKVGRKYWRKTRKKYS
jgi:Trp operon repressor